MHSLHSITRKGVLTAWLCYHLCQCLAKPASAGTMLPCRILLMGVGVAHQKTGGEGRVEELQCLSFCFYNIWSSQSWSSDLWGPHMAGKATPTTLALLVWRPQQCSCWRSTTCCWVWSWTSSELPALLCRHGRVLGHKNSHDQLVWKRTANFFF